MEMGITPLEAAMNALKPWLTEPERGSKAAVQCVTMFLNAALNDEATMRAMADFIRSRSLAWIAQGGSRIRDADLDTAETAVMALLGALLPRLLALISL
jgi:hypothetical protein